MRKSACLLCGNLVKLTNAMNPMVVAALSAATTMFVYSGCHPISLQERKVVTSYVGSSTNQVLSISNGFTGP